MSALIEVILPVFLIIGFGYAAARAGLFDEASVNGVMRFAQGFAVPCLLFRSIAQLDLGAAFQAGLLLSFYIGAFAAFAITTAAAVWLFKRPITDAVAIGFASYFSNTLLLGLPITERAYGVGALAGNYAIIAIHSPLLYAFGITLMEITKSRGQDLSALVLIRQILRAIASQPLVIGLALGFALNLSGIGLAGPLKAAVDLMVSAAIPTALFGLGGVLFRYRPEGDKATIAMICAASLLLHPMITYLLARFGFGLDTAALRSATITAAMAPGVNAYMFSHLYGVAKRVTATAVLVATALSMLSIWGWLHLLP